MREALLSALRHAATAAAGALSALQFAVDVSFVRSVYAALAGAAFAGLIRFLMLVGEVRASSEP